MSPIARNIAANLAGSAIPLLVTFFTVPLYLSLIGAPRYGVLLIAFSLLGYFGFLDLGISRATTHALARMANSGTTQKKRDLFWSATLLNLLLGTAGAVILYAGGMLIFTHLISIPAELSGEIAQSIGYLSLMLPVTIVLSVAVGASESHERFGLLNIIQTIGMILAQALPLLCVLWFGPSLTIILPVMLAIRVITLVATFALALSVLQIGFPPHINLRATKPLLGFGLWVTISNVISPIMTSIDQFVIATLRGVAQVPYYAVPMTMVIRTQIIPATLVRTLFPVFSRETEKTREKLAARALLGLAILTAVLYGVAILLAAHFFHWWIGPDFAAAATIPFQILCLGAWWNALGFVLHSALQAQGKPRIVALIHAGEIVPYLIALWLLVAHFGLTGAAIAWSLRVAVDTMLLALASKLSTRTFLPLLPCFLLVAGAMILAQT